MKANAWPGAPDPVEARPPETGKTVDLISLGACLVAYGICWLVGLVEGGMGWTLVRVALPLMLPFWLVLQARRTPRHRELLAVHIVGTSRWAVVHAALVLAATLVRGSVPRAAVGLLASFCVYKAAYVFLVGADLRAAVRLMTVQ